MPCVYTDVCALACEQSLTLVSASTLSFSRKPKLASPISFHSRPMATSSVSPPIQAITIAKTGGPEVIEKTSIPFPSVAPGDILIKVISSRSAWETHWRSTPRTGSIFWYQLYRHLLSVNYTALSPTPTADPESSQGVYPLSTFPAVIGSEAAGIIISLPTDPSVLDQEDYKKRGYQVGGKVAVVRPSLSLIYCAKLNLIFETGEQRHPRRIYLHTMGKGLRCSPILVDPSGRSGFDSMLHSRHLHDGGVPCPEG